MKSQLGISTREGGQYPQNPIAPTRLVANLLPDGRIKLHWDRNGNAPNVLFIIEYRLMPAGNWTLLDFVTKTSYIHAGYPIGTTIEYLVKARKTNKTPTKKPPRFHLPGRLFGRLIDAPEEPTPADPRPWAGNSDSPRAGGRPPSRD